MYWDVAVIGGGIAGLSIAAGLARDRKVCVLEGEMAPGYHSSGRSAATLSMTYGDELIEKLTAVGNDFYRNPPADFSEEQILKPRDRLLIARQDQRSTLAVRYRQLRGLADWLERDDLLSAYSFFKPSYADCAILDRRGGDLDVHEIMMGYSRQIKSGSGAVRFDFRVTHIERGRGVWQIRSGSGETAEAKTVVNAAGAWADQTAVLAGVPAIGLEPRRRTACIIPPPPDMDTARLPFVIDIDEDFYFKPETGDILISPADETPSEPTDAQPEEYDIALAVHRIEQATTISVQRVLHKWAGLRTFVADRHPVVGFDPQAEDFFWFAGQGGYGFQIAPGLQRFAVDLMSGNPVEEDVRSALSPGRYR